MPAAIEAQLRRAVDSIIAVHERAEISLCKIRSIGLGTPSALGACARLEQVLHGSLEKVEAQARGGFERFGLEWEQGDGQYSDLRSL